MWWIDCGPNLVSLNSTELNCVAYDWDEDGKAEILMRGADNMIIHKADGTVYKVGDMNVNTRTTGRMDSQYAWTTTGNEYLLYLDGATAAPFNTTLMPFPIARESASAWGDDYGHRSNKFFFGAPFLDGRKASIFLARGIYERIKMTVLDVDASHNLTVRTGWPWECNTSGSPWYGQGNHNMTIADVDGDGCDEIVYGSMVIDNNGKGLSTTGLGHGDALHVSDLDPFRKGLEVFACNEDKPSNNYRDAATSEILFRTGPTYDDKGKLVDDGRCMAGNFSSKYPGSIAASTCSGVISLTSQKEIDGMQNQCFAKPWDPMTLDFRIYWDGNLLEESLDGTGTERECTILSENGNRILTTSGCAMNNDSKNNPCAQGDILGDWREEIILRSVDNKELRVFSTDYPTEYRIPSLWYDHQYRQAMVWQVCAYNQPPHASFFLGELEGITKAPVPLTNEGREIITSNSVNSSIDGKQVLYAPTQNSTFTIDGTVKPSVFVFNVPTMVSGSDDNNNIQHIKYNCNVTYANNGSISGAAHVVKQGDGLLIFPNKTFGHTGGTEVWAGELQLNRTALGDLWMNRHTTLYAYHASNDSKKINNLIMEYGTLLDVSSKNTGASDVQNLNVGTLTLKEGARVKLDLTQSGNDVIYLTNLVIETKDWQYGPKYLSPVFEFVTEGKFPGNYPRVKIGTITGSLTGSLDNIVIEGIEMQNDNDIYYLEQDDTDLYITFKTIDSEITKPVKLSDEEWKLNFENTSSNNYGFTSIRINEQAEGGNTHCLHLGVSNESGARSSNREFTEDDFRTTGDYTFEFDFAAASGNNNTDVSTISVLGTNATLFTIKYNNYAKTANIYDNSNNEIGKIEINPYTSGTTSSDNYIPTISR